MLKVLHATYSDENHSNTRDLKKQKENKREKKEERNRRGRGERKFRNEPKSWKIIKNSPRHLEIISCVASDLALKCCHLKL